MFLDKVKENIQKKSPHVLAATIQLDFCIMVGLVFLFGFIMGRASFEHIAQVGVYKFASIIAFLSLLISLMALKLYLIIQSLKNKCSSN